MSTTQNERLYDLLLARSQTAMELATTFLMWADPCAEMANTVPDWVRTSRHQLADLEAVNCALLLQAGVSWDALAAQQEVSRQALHRRLAQPVDRLLSEDQSQHSDWREDDLHLDLNLTSRLGRHLRANMMAELARGPDIWSSRRHRPGWWRRDFAAIREDWQ
jgi:hypothetical protein